MLNYRKKKTFQKLPIVKKDHRRKLKVPDDEFEDQSDSDTDDEIDLDKNFIGVAADTG